MKHGDFSGLAKKYSAYRSGYSISVKDALFALLTKPAQECNLADVGAGTGIWTRILSSNNPGSLIAIEPNDDMRNQGIKDSKNTKIQWQKGDGENTNLPNQSIDMVSMASSFHWVNFEKGTQEFHRILKPGGRFVALWNPRKVEENPLLKKMEDYLYVLNPDLKRVSSGNSGLVETLTEKLYASKLFTDLVYLEGRHVAQVTPDEYIGAWKSVNDVQFQLGEKKFNEFIQYVKNELKNEKTVEVTYLTRAWSARKL